MFFFGPNVKKMSERHNISGLLKILENPNKGKRNTRLRIEALGALSEFCHFKVFKGIINIIENDAEVPNVRSAAQQALMKLTYTKSSYTYSESVNWWNQNKDDPKLISSNRSRIRFEELANVKSAAQRMFKPPQAIKSMIYQKSYDDSSLVFPELIEWQNRTQPLIDARVQAEQTRLEARWHEEDLVWERDEEILNQK